MSDTFKYGLVLIAFYFSSLFLAHEAVAAASTRKRLATESSTNTTAPLVVNLTSIWSNFLPIELSLVNAQFYNFTSFNGNLTIDNPASYTALNNIYVQTILLLYTKYYYLLSVYKFDPPDFSQQMISFYINFCDIIYDYESCVPNFNPNTSVTAYNVTGGVDILFAISIQDYTVSCDVVYNLEEECGTFLEIHRPFDERLIEEKSLNMTTPNTFYFDYINGKNVCAGKYEIWVVYRTLIGSIIQYVYPFFVTGPSCTCQNVQQVGLSC